eukprot:1302918-Rhodomonas_salina.5
MSEQCSRTSSSSVPERTFRKQCGDWQRRSEARTGLRSSLSGRSVRSEAETEAGSNLTLRVRGESDADRRMTERF